MFGFISISKKAGSLLICTFIYYSHCFLMDEVDTGYEKSKLKKSNFAQMNNLQNRTYNKENHDVNTYSEDFSKLEVSSLHVYPESDKENYKGMICVGIDDVGKMLGDDDVITYIFGTGFDKHHQAILEEDLYHLHYGPDSLHDIASRSWKSNSEKNLNRRKIRRLNDIPQGPKPFGYHDIHPLDGGRDPPVVVSVDPFFMDSIPVTNKDFGKFVRATYYKTEAEHYGWAFVLSSFLTNANLFEKADVDPDAKDWVVVDGAYWRAPEGPGSSYNYRMNHPVVHVSHRDAAEYCAWKGKRLPGEWEWEAAARSGMFDPQNRTLYSWGDDQSTRVAKKYTNLWGEGEFPWTNHAEDGWRGTNPVYFYPPNTYGFFDLTGNVWEWMRGGKHKARIVRGGSYVDSLDGSFNHAATIGARATLHGTTATGNIGFRCAKSPKRRNEYLYDSDEMKQYGQLALEDKHGNTYIMGQGGLDNEIKDNTVVVDKFGKSNREKRKVSKTGTRLSNEL